MDPALLELIQAGDGADVLEAIAKLRYPSRPPARMRIAARFGDVVTCRLRRRDIEHIRSDPNVLALKAPRLLGSIDRDVIPRDDMPEEVILETEGRRPHNLRERGRGTIVAVLDWGIDFALDAFRDPDGRSRFRAIWDQSADVNAPLRPYGYGRLITRAEIDSAVRALDPYAALGYHPASGDPSNTGSHGTHVFDIAAGSGLAPRAIEGIAPEADLIFVHLASGRLGGLADLGDSVRILEGLDFVSRIAGETVWAANLSLGRHAGNHMGLSLVEQGIDNLLAEAPGRAISQSCGNYHRSDTHTAGSIAPGKRHTLTWIIDKADRTENELDLRYHLRDRLGVKIVSPDGVNEFSVPLREQTDIVIDGRTVGRFYHRENDSVTSDNHVAIFLFSSAPAGEWHIVLDGERIVDGRFHAWIERDASCRGCQSRFAPRDAVRTTTLGSICTGYHTVATGAYNAHSGRGDLVSSSSSGPTRDGRQKPDLVAPGRSVLAARSTSAGQPIVNGFVRKTGTSMASPHVAGCMVLIHEAANQPIGVHEMRRILIGSADPPIPEARTAPARIGAGYLNIETAVREARKLRLGNSESIGTEIEAVAASGPAGSTQREEKMAGETLSPASREWQGASSDAADLIEGVEPYTVEEMPAESASLEFEPIAPEDTLNLIEHVFGLVLREDRSGMRPSEDELAATVFDVFSTSAPFPQRPLLERMFSVAAQPGEFLDIGQLPESAIVIQRPLADGNFARMAALDVSRLRQAGLAGAPFPSDEAVELLEISGGITGPARSVIRRLTDEAGRLRGDTVILSVRPESEGQSSELAPLGVAVAGAFAGAAFKEIFGGVARSFADRYDIATASASHVWTKSPPGLPLYRRVDRITFRLEKLGRDKVTNFNLGLIYDGFSLHDAAITFREADSNLLPGHSFQARFRAREIGRNDNEKEPVLQIFFPFSGRWDPFLWGDENFTGSILVSGDGRVKAQMQPRTDTVEIRHTLGVRTTLRLGQQIQPPSPAPTTSPSAPVPPRPSTPLGSSSTGGDLSIRRAIASNRRWGQRLGWIGRVDDISRLLGFTNISPDEQAFAEAVAQWQQKNGLPVDGIIGPNTWSRMQSLLAPTPAPVPGPGGSSGGELSAKIAAVAVQEWERWSRGRIKETDPRITGILRDYWRTGVNRNFSEQQIQDPAWQSTHPWSAAFISWVMRSAGAGTDFHYSAAHRVYVSSAKRNRIAGNRSNPFWAYRIDEVAPRVGDLVCRGRSKVATTYDNVDDGTARPTHCDIVTEIGPGRIYVIGGNVNHSVWRRPVKVGNDGLVDTSGRQRVNFAIVRVGQQP